jgi:polyphosphate kinase
MTRNLNRRVEVLFPVEDPALIERLRSEILEGYLRDNIKARVMQADGTYVRAAATEGEPPLDSQEEFIYLANNRKSEEMEGKGESVSG